MNLYLETPTCAHCGNCGYQLFSADITRNLEAMASAAGLYRSLWRPNENGYWRARDIIGPLNSGLEWLRTHEAEAREHDAENGWGTYEQFVPLVEQVLAACKRHPNAAIRVCR